MIWYDEAAINGLQLCAADIVIQWNGAQQESELADHRSFLSSTNWSTCFSNLPTLWWEGRDSRTSSSVVLQMGGRASAPLWRIRWHRRCVQRLRQSVGLHLIGASLPHISCVHGQRSSLRLERYHYKTVRKCDEMSIRLNTIQTVGHTDRIDITIAICEHCLLMRDKKKFHWQTGVLTP